MKIRLISGDTVLLGTLNDSEAARDFASLLPLQVTLEDYAGIEKVVDLPKRLSTEGSPAGFKATAGDITYYAPWGNLAIFNRNFRYADGLVILGKFDGDIEILRSTGALNVTIELDS